MPALNRRSELVLLIPSGILVQCAVNGRSCCIVFIVRLEASCPYCPTSVSMQQPGQQVTELAMQNSVSAVVARIRARSCGTPMPFASQVPVQNSESGRGYTIGREYPCMGSGSAHASILAPVCASLTFCVIVGKSLHMFGK
ncbi:Kdelc1 [Symbiodinium sp. CCMP2592]|nr:Kdelc1 [Symbiodinium sp. CCMP2592]